MSEENKNSNNRTAGIIGTVAFHLLALLVILLLALTTPLPLPGEEGVEVNLGSSDYGMGNVQEQSPPPAEQNTPPPPPPSNDPEPQTEEEIITQDVEEAPAIEEEVVEDPAPETPKPVIEDTDIEAEPMDDEIIPDEVIEDPEPAQVYNPEASYQGNPITEGDGSNEGNTGQPGDLGQDNGTPDATNYEGSGGLGDEGVGFDLTGRNSKSLPIPTYESDELGTIVVKIRVDQDGKVISAIAGGQGTTITNERLRRLVEEAAMNSLFDSNEARVQAGTITYRIKRQ
jgi:outer membrane biosynthesis protein TonB